FQSFLNFSPAWREPAVSAGFRAEKPELTIPQRHVGDAVWRAPPTELPGISIRHPGDRPRRPLPAPGIWGPPTAMQPWPGAEPHSGRISTIRLMSRFRRWGTAVAIR